ncbi:hypothetical protein EVG20_g1714 [Dentipellis fragilis]|uniref:Uncharacterized protein n=1 Tax=Dentipellis fragilis TaxID=205917 RepID=A0A4Y9ZBT8_9AGAM|nr:hypothetical protein EVG20_g1714 [Dentipellis fragilis]
MPGPSPPVRRSQDSPWRRQLHASTPTHKYNRGADQSDKAAAASVQPSDLQVHRVQIEEDREREAAENGDKARVGCASPRKPDEDESVLRFPSTSPTHRHTHRARYLHALRPLTLRPTAGVSAAARVWLAKGAVQRRYPTQHRSFTEGRRADSCVQKYPPWLAARGRSHSGNGSAVRWDDYRV